MARSNSPCGGSPALIDLRLAFALNMGSLTDAGLPLGVPRPTMS